MTLSDDGTKVSLSIGNWIGLASLIFTTVGVPCMVLQGRLTVVEIRTENLEKQYEQESGRNNQKWSEVLAEIRAVRQELKVK